MCTKHKACQSKHTSVQGKQQSCCADNLASGTVAVDRVSSGHSDQCSAASGSDSVGEDDESGSSGFSDSNTQFSWYIEGMDCPSCARKIETAVKQLDGIEQVKVTFATEKLLVETGSAHLIEQVEQAVTRAGFRFRRAEGHDSYELPSDQPELSAWRLWLSNNLQVVLISLAIVVAASIQPFYPQIGRGLFFLTCISGLLPIVKKAVTLARTGSPFSIETLMSVAALGALYLGETVEATMVLLLFLIGERLEAYAASRARSGVQSLMKLVPENAVKLVDGIRITVPASDLVPGDLIEISPGGRLPADGLLEDATSLDESALTGEPLPVERLAGEAVMAGAVVVDRVVRLKVTSKQGQNAIDRILHLIEQAEARKAPLERFLDQFSRWYTPTMMLLALLVIILPPLMFGQEWQTWIYRGLALLLIACPCALVISTPAAITSGLAAAARRGALIKGGAALERLGKVELMAFDKTGTLTLGKPGVTDIIGHGEFSRDEILASIAAIEVGSSHPLAVSLVDRAAQQQLSLAEADNKRALIGSGVEGEINGCLYQAIAPSKLAIPMPEQLAQQVTQLEREGKTVVVATRRRDQLMGLIAWQDTVREDARHAIQALDYLGIQALMLTGDNPRSAEHIGLSIGIDFEANLLPEDKVAHIEQMSQQCHVAMVGDGINDAPAMKAAGVGIAMGGGTDVALETADAAITHNRLLELAGMIELSRATLQNIRQNITLALGLKGVFLVTSLFGITGLWVAVLADSGATALVTLNALRLLKFKSKLPSLQVGGRDQ
ncbi:zinc/cadmium/mercury/lead-transporting ATPase [Vibrio sp.]|uniref:zinc/cadmium/mercury/lead-transporting ATPase n=1 Tax=Vibrio sp. TaxID=678 RepID=UPI003D132188